MYLTTKPNSIITLWCIPRMNSSYYWHHPNINTLLYNKTKLWVKFLRTHTQGVSKEWNFVDTSRNLVLKFIIRLWNLKYNIWLKQSTKCSLISRSESTLRLYSSSFLTHRMCKKTYLFLTFLRRYPRLYNEIGIS